MGPQETAKTLAQAVPEIYYDLIARIAPGTIIVVAMFLILFPHQMSALVGGAGGLGVGSAAFLLVVGACVTYGMAMVTAPIGIVFHRWNQRACETERRNLSAEVCKHRPKTDAEATASELEDVARVEIAARNAGAGDLLIKRGAEVAFLHALAGGAPILLCAHAIRIAASDPAPLRLESALVFGIIAGAFSLVMWGGRIQTRALMERMTTFLKVLPPRASA